MANTILRRGPSGVNNTNVNAPSRLTNADTLPGTICKIDSGKYAIAGTSDDDEALFVVKNNALRGEAIDTTVKANTTIGAYEFINDGRVLQIRASAATYTDGQKLQLAANGRLAAQTGTNTVIAYVQSGKTITAAQVTANTNYLDVTPA